MICRYIDLRDIEEWIGQGWQVRLIGGHHRDYGIAWRVDA
jgi:hypothetical protein